MKDATTRDPAQLRGALRAIAPKKLRCNRLPRQAEICCTVQNVAKGNKIAKTGLKNVFFIH
jgi:hypothetical protein